MERKRERKRIKGTKKRQNGEGGRLMEEGWKEGVRWVKDGWERGDTRGEELEREKLKKGRME